MDVYKDSACEGILIVQYPDFLIISITYNTIIL